MPTPSTSPAIRRPACAIGVAALPKGAKVEIDAIVALTD
jgi:enamine deaminase RidA (YjgF/YER057c/UK114 family)